MRSRLAEVAARVAEFSGQPMNEATTKNALVEPFLRALGYDPSNPREVALEYTADVGIKRGEKIDYAILHNGQPAMLIECKPVGTALVSDKCSQLLRYYGTKPEAKIGILTDGVKYLIFTDTVQPNIMDPTPFMEVDLSGEYERWIPELEKLTREKWDLPGMLSAAEVLKYLQGLKSVFAEELASPSDELARHLIGRAYDGKVTPRVRERMAPLVKRAMQEHINDLTRQKLRSAIESESSAENVTQQENLEEDDIITTADEINGYLIVKAILRPVLNPKRVGMRDAKAYCAILCDDNNRKQLCRFYFTERKMSIMLFDTGEGERVYLADLDGLYELADRLKETAKKYL